MIPSPALLGKESFHARRVVVGWRTCWPAGPWEQGRRTGMAMLVLAGTDRVLPVEVDEFEQRFRARVDQACARILASVGLKPDGQPLRPAPLPAPADDVGGDDLVNDFLIALLEEKGPSDQPLARPSRTRAIPDRVPAPPGTIRKLPATAEVSATRNSKAAPKAVPKKAATGKTGSAAKAPGKKPADKKPSPDGSGSRPTTTDTPQPAREPGYRGASPRRRPRQAALEA